MVGLALTVWWVGNSSVFDLRTLTVSGNHRLSDAQVMRIAGLGDSTNLVVLSTESVQRRLEADPWIMDARVSRSLPSTVTIRITERTPVAVASGRLVAADGIVLGPAPAGATLPELGGALPTTATRIPAGLMPELVMARALSSGRGTTVARISTEPDQTMTATMRDGLRVLLGDDTQAAAKWDAVAGVLAWSSRNSVKPGYVDVRVPSFPALGPKALAAASPAPGA